MKLLNLLLIFNLVFLLSCAQEGESESGLIVNHQQVDDIFEVSMPSDGAYGSGQTLSFTLTHPKEITVDGAPSLTITIGEEEEQAVYSSGSGSTSLVFTYTTQSGDEDLDGIELDEDINLNGGSLTYATNGVIITAPDSISSIPTSEIIIGTNTPVIIGAASPVPKTYAVGDSMFFVLTYDDIMLINGGTPRLTLDIGGVTQYASYVSGTGTSILIFSYTVVSSDFDNDGIGVSSPIDLNGSTLTDLYGNTADLTFATPDTSSILVDGTAPYVESVTQPSDGTYFNGENINIDLVFNQSVIVNTGGGTPSITLDIGGNTRVASYVSGSGTTTLRFQYLVTGGDIDSDGLRIGDLISLNSGTIQDGGGDDALLDYRVPLTPNVLVYGLTPAIVSVTAPDDGDYVTSGNLDFTIKYSESVVVTNSPQLSITIGGSNQVASYLSGTGTDEIIFRYTVQAADNDNDGISFQNNLIDLNTSGTISSSFSGSNADLDFTGLAPVMTAVTVNQAPATKVAFTTQPSNAYVSTDISPSIVVEVRDATDAVVPSYNDNVTLAFGTDASTGSGVLGGTLTVAAVNGIATFSDIDINYVASGYTLVASSGALTTATSDTFDILALNSTKVAFNVQPSNTLAGDAITASITVEIQDSSSNVVTAATNNITLSLGTDPSSGSATLGGTLTQAAVNGVATFNDITIDKAFNGYILQATAAGLTSDSSSSFNISANTKSQVAFTVEPSNTEINASVNPAIVVEIQDAYGNITTDTDTITLVINNDPPSGTTLGGTVSVPATAGSASFSDITFDQYGVGFTLDATAAGLTTDTSSGFDITTTPTQLFITQEPSNTYTGFDISPAITIEIRDGSNNLVNSATDSVTVAIGTNPAGGTLSGTTTVAAINGVATFSDLNIDNAGAGYTLNFTATGLTSDTSTSFNITQAPASQLAFSTEPVNTVAGATMSNVVVQVQDASGNVVTSASDNITLSFNTDPSTGAATFGGTLTVAAVSGVATFNDLTLDKAFAGYILDASATGLSSATSASFEITPATKTKLGFKVQPANTNENTNFTPSIEVSVLDAYDNIVTSASDSITMALDTDPSSGSASVSGTLTKSASSGVATFDDVQIDWPESGYTFIATSGGLTGATSNSFVIFGAPAKLGFIVQPQDTEIGNNLADFTVAIQDSAGNTIGNSNDVITLTLGSDPSAGSATLSGTLSVAAVAGVATFSGLNLDEAYADFTFNASSGSLTGATSTPFDITISPPSGLSLTAGQPGVSPDSDTTPTITVSGVLSGDSVKLYTDSDCSAANEIASYTSSSTSIDITTNSLAEGSYTIYATRSSGAGNTSVCSTASVDYEVQGSFYQLDSIANNDFGNWSDGGGDRSWSTDTDTTQTTGVGPTAPKAGTHYGYTEASNPTNPSDEFILVSNIVDGSANDLAFSFWWNKRGDNMGDLYVDASSDGGSTWTNVFTHTGFDVATNGADVWNEEWFDLCDLGFTTSNTQLRIRGIMPATGTTADSDMAIDELEISSGGCLPGTPAEIAITSPLSTSIIGITNMSSFTVSGTCSDNGENIAFSGDVSGSTTCSSGSWSYDFNLSALADGDVVIRADHTSASGGPNGTAISTYTKEATTIQFDAFEALGNWTQDATDDRDWTLTTGDTPSANVGPSSGQGGSGGYIFTEATSPTANSDEFIIFSNSLDADAYDMDMEFYWNKRGVSMGTIYVEVSPDDGITWDTASFTHTGDDVAKGGTDVWNAENIDLCTLGYNSGTLKVRIRVQMVASGNPKDSDVGIDSVKFTTNGCQ